MKFLHKISFNLCPEIKDGTIFVSLVTSLGVRQLRKGGVRYHRVITKEKIEGILGKIKNKENDINAGIPPAFYMLLQTYAGQTAAP